MKRFPFKRQLMILASIIAALCIAVPVATFAHASSNPPGEQKRIQPAVRTQAVAGQPTAITADCSAPQLLVTLNKGDIFKANATLISTDPNEESEGEFLHILDASTNPPTNLLTVDNNAGSGNVTFTATVNNDPIQACIVATDDDETGSVTFTVTAQGPTTIEKHIPIVGSKGLFDTVKDALHKFGGKLALACTIDILGEKVKLIGVGANATTVITLDYDLAKNPVNRDLLAMKVVIALVDLLPGSGCAQSLVNLFSLGGIDLLKQCLTDRACLTQVENDSQVKQKLCFATIGAIAALIPGSFLILTFEAKQLC